MVACIAMTAYFLVGHPSTADYLRPAAAVTLAVVLAGGVWVAVKPPRTLISTSSRVASRVGLGAALLLAVGLVVTSRIALSGDLGVNFDSNAAVWAVLTGVLAVSALELLEALYWYRVDARLIFDGATGNPIGDNLGGFIWGLVGFHCGGCRSG